MSKAEVIEREIELLEREIRRYEQLNMTSDKYYILLQIERTTRIAELEFCKENNLQEVLIMTMMSLKEGIKRLVEKRKTLEPFSEEQRELNIKLDKLYTCYWLMLEQEERV